MTMPSIQSAIQYGGDFRVGSRSDQPTITIIGDSRQAGLQGDGVNTPIDYLGSLPTFNGKTFLLRNRAWQSLTAKRALSDPQYSIDAPEQGNSSFAFSGPLDIVIVGPLGVNDLAGGDTVANIKTYNENLCKYYKSLGCVVVFFSEISAGTTVGGVTGDSLKNQMRAWAVAGGAGSEYWRTFSDAYIDPGLRAPYGQDHSGTYGTSGLGYLNSTKYSIDTVHWNNGGHQDVGAWMGAQLTTLINSLVSNSYVKTKSLPGLLSHECRLASIEARLTVGGL